MMTLDEWLNLPLPRWSSNAYVAYPGIGVLYVRKSQRCVGYKPSIHIPAVLTQCIDIATVEVDEERRGRGHFTNLIKYLHGSYNIYVENVMNERLARFLERSGFQIENTTPLSFYLAREATFAP